MSKSASPFAGIKLTDQTALGNHGADQQLFNPAPRVPPKLSKEPTKEARKEGSLETWNQGNAEKPTAKEHPLFDINDTAYQSNTYVFTEQELWAIEDAKNELERKHG